VAIEVWSIASIGYIEEYIYVWVWTRMGLMVVKQCIFSFPIPIFKSAHYEILDSVYVFSPFNFKAKYHNLRFRNLVLASRSFSISAHTYLAASRQSAPFSLLLVSYRFNNSLSFSRLLMARSIGASGGKYPLDLRAPSILTAITAKRQVDKIS